MIKANMEIKADNSNASSNYERVMGFIEQQAEDVIPPNSHELATSAGELISNIFNYAYEPGNEGSIFIECLNNPKKRVFRIVARDNGKPFNPIEWSDSTNVRVVSCDSMTKRLGILIARRYTPDIHYRRENDQNVLTITKRY